MLTPQNGGTKFKVKVTAKKRFTRIIIIILYSSSQLHDVMLKLVLSNCRNCPKTCLWPKRL